MKKIIWGLALLLAIAGGVKVFASGFDSGGVDTGGSSGGVNSGGWTHGSSKVTLTTSTDNVGIGSSSPRGPLDVAGTAYMGSAGTGVVGASSGINFDSNNVDGTSAAEMKLSSGGVLGIGTTSPDVGSGALGLDCYSPGSQGCVFILKGAGGASVSGGEIHFLRASGSLSSPTDVAAGSVLGMIAGYGYDSTNGWRTTSDIKMQMFAESLWTATSHPTVFSWSGTASGSITKGEQMRLDSNGNLGIGSTAPRGKLDIGAGSYYGDGSQLSGITSGGWTDSGTTIYNTTVSDNVGIGTSAAAANKLSVTGSENITGNLGIGTTVPLSNLEIVGVGTTSATTSLKIKDSAQAVKFMIQDDGNVGIGTTAPGAKFEIAGTNAAGGGFILSSTTGTTKRRFTCYPSGNFSYACEAVANNTFFWSEATADGGQATLGIIGNAGVPGSSKVSIGTTTTPGSKLGVWGGVSVGTTGYYTVAAPTNGMIIAGNVGIGTTAPEFPLTIRKGGSLMSKKTGANTACTTTCGTASCYFGEDTGVLGTLLDCADTTADVCLCAGN